MIRAILSVLLAVLGVLPAGCGKAETENIVVVYVAVDEPIARPILSEFNRQTGIKVRIKTDAEGTKTAGLAAALEAERDNPRADVWWGNEPFYTINLAEKGILAPYESPAHKAIPATYRDAESRWAGTGLRVRVMGVTTKLPATMPAELQKAWPPRDLADLTNPALKGRIAMARPSAGTTGGHVASWFVALGDEKALAFLHDLKRNDIVMLGGNAEVARQVGRGQIWAGLTDNDDVDAAKSAGGGILMVLPDQEPDGMGTLPIPCTVGLVAGARHSENAKRLIDYLLSKEVEKKLLDARFARYSVYATESPQPIKPMAVDYRQVARKMPHAVSEAMKILTASVQSPPSENP